MTDKRQCRELWTFAAVTAFCFAVAVWLSTNSPIKAMVTFVGLCIYLADEDERPASHTERHRHAARRGCQNRADSAC